MCKLKKKKPCVKKYFTTDLDFTLHFAVKYDRLNDKSIKSCIYSEKVLLPMKRGKKWKI